MLETITASGQTGLTQLQSAFDLAKQRHIICGATPQLSLQHDQLVHSAAFAASGRLFDLNEAVKTDQMKLIIAIMVCQGEAIPSPNQCG